MPFLTVYVQEGISRDQKLTLLKRLTAVTQEALDVRPEVVRVVIEETPRDNWAWAGLTWEELKQPDGTAPQIPFLIVRFVEGFPEERKVNLISGLCRTAAEVLDTELSLVKGIFEEVPRSAWANGGVRLCDLSL